jgi:hypothetical protein
MNQWWTKWLERESIAWLLTCLLAIWGWRDGVVGFESALAVIAGTSGALMVGRGLAKMKGNG